MKKYLIILLFTGLTMVLSTSCLEEYLDKAPEQGLTEEEVFGKYENFRLFFDAVYTGTSYFEGGWYNFNIRTAFPLYYDFIDQKWTWETFTDAADQGRQMQVHTFKSGNASFVSRFTYDGKRRPILSSMFKDIRICNMALKNIHYLEENNVDEVEINDLKGQAHFVRAFCHFELFRLWGAMPYITKVIGPDDQWDLARLSKYETCVKIAQDFDTAAYYFNLAGRMRRDPGPGEVGHLADPLQGRPTGVAAKAYKSRALLYGASPLNNQGGITAWQNAAVASWEAIVIAKEYQYELLSAEDRKLNYVGASYTNEQLWAWTAGTKTWNTGDWAGIVNGVFGNNKTSWSGVCPTQNWVDKYETKWGEPLNTQTDRDAATTAGHYYEQNPYIDRDPRFDFDIIYNQSSCLNWTNNKAQLYYTYSGGKATYSELLDQAFLGISKTFYYERKRWGEQSTKNRVSKIYTDPLFRFAELYLNYAEAANEAYGPDGMAPDADLSAVQAINLIRERVNHVPVPGIFTASTEDFRPRIRNERNIELSWEGHYYFDIRRWMEAPDVGRSTLYGMDIEKLEEGSYDPAEYPTGFRHNRKALPSDRQIGWKDAMYYLPFDTEDNFKMKNFVPNTVW